MIITSAIGQAWIHNDLDQFQSSGRCKRMTKSLSVIDMISPWQLSSSFQEAFTCYKWASLQGAINCSSAALTIYQTLASLAALSFRNFMLCEKIKLHDVTMSGFSLHVRTSGLSNNISLWKGFQCIALPSAHWILQISKGRLANTSQCKRKQNMGYCFQKHDLYKHSAQASTNDTRP